MFVWNIEDAFVMLAVGFFVLLALAAFALVAYEKLTEWWAHRWIRKNIPELASQYAPDPRATLSLELGCIYYSLTDTYDDTVCSGTIYEVESRVPVTVDERRRSLANAKRVKRACARVAMQNGITADFYEQGFAQALDMSRSARDKVTMGSKALVAVQKEL